MLGPNEVSCALAERRRAEPGAWAPAVPGPLQVPARSVRCLGSGFGGARYPCRHPGDLNRHGDGGGRAPTTRRCARTWNLAAACGPELRGLPPFYFISGVRSGRTRIRTRNSTRKAMSPASSAMLLAKAESEGAMFRYMAD